ncbi:MAG: asparagine synthase-related protein, partial [Acidobacteriota bacterium]|nr:asparagine synthase-related protein [Acidobacteriota bacterium]
MTLIAGIFSRENRSIPASACESLRRSISRHSVDEVHVFKDDRSYFVKIDIGAFSEPGFLVESSGALSMLAGEPLLAGRDATTWPSRKQDLELIHEGFRRGDCEILRRAEGTFSVVNYQPRSGTLHLIADKLGLRPLYYWIDERYVIFASALRILEALVEIPKKMDVRAVTEMVALGHPLGRRTPYANIFLLKAAEVVKITEEKISRSNYWRWDDITPSSEPEEKLLQELYDRFESGVACRNRRDTTTVAYLSGGLDSRCTVAALHSENVRVHTFNFARPGTQDQIFGLDFARRIDAVHEEVPKEAGDLVPDYSSLMAQVWGASSHRQAYPAERPSLVWSGEGGSVALGHVHMNEKIVGLMRAGQVDGAIEEYVEREYVYVSRKLFRPKIGDDLAGVVNQGIREELDGLHSQDPARSFYLFLLLNDQRRKLAGHFENIDLHRLEFQLPFFDSAFLASIIAIPIDLCLRHKLYVKWLAYFHRSVASVPWQAYPGHEPCPHPIPQGLVYQWEQKYQIAERTSQRRELIEQASALLSTPGFPHEILSKRNLRLAAWLHSLGWRDYEHIIKAAQMYGTYWKSCDGEY